MLYYVCQGVQTVLLSRVLHLSKRRFPPLPWIKPDYLSFPRCIASTGLLLSMDHNNVCRKLIKVVLNS